MTIVGTIWLDESHKKGSQWKWRVQEASPFDTATDAKILASGHLFGYRTYGEAAHAMSIALEEYTGRTLLVRT